MTTSTNGTALPHVTVQPTCFGWELRIDGVRAGVFGTYPCKPDIFEATYEPV